MSDLCQQPSHDPQDLYPGDNVVDGLLTCQPCLYRVLAEDESATINGRLWRRPQAADSVRQEPAPAGAFPLSSPSAEATR